MGHVLTKALEPIFSIPPALQKHLCQVGKQKSNFPAMNKQGPFTSPNRALRRGEGCRTAAEPL